MSKHFVAQGIFAHSEIDMSRYPLTNRIFDARAALEALVRAAAQRQPDAVM